MQDGANPQTLVAEHSVLMCVHYGRAVIIGSKRSSAEHCRVFQATAPFIERTAKAHSYLEQRTDAMNDLRAHDHAMKAPLSGEATLQIQPFAILKPQYIQNGSPVLMHDTQRLAQSEQSLCNKQCPPGSRGLPLYQPPGGAC